MQGDRSVWLRPVWAAQQIITGLHSNIPLCCVLAFTFRGKRGDPDGASNYVRCSRCLASGRIQPLHRCRQPFMRGSASWLCARYRRQAEKRERDIMAALHMLSEDEMAQQYGVRFIEVDDDEWAALGGLPDSMYATGTPDTASPTPEERTK